MKLKIFYILGPALYDAENNLIRKFEITYAKDVNCTTETKFITFFADKFSVDITCDKDSVESMVCPFENIFIFIY